MLLKGAAALETDPSFPCKFSSCSYIIVCETGVIIRQPTQWKNPNMLVCRCTSSLIQPAMQSERLVLTKARARTTILSLSGQHGYGNPPFPFISSFAPNKINSGTVSEKSSKSKGRQMSIDPFCRSPTTYTTLEDSTASYSSG